MINILNLIYRLLRAFSVTIDIIWPLIVGDLDTNVIFDDSCIIFNYKLCIKEYNFSHGNGPRRSKNGTFIQNGYINFHFLVH